MESARYVQLKARLAQYIACEQTITIASQEYSIDRRRYQRADLKEVTDMIKYLEEELSKQWRLDNNLGSRKTYGIIPRDV